MHYTSFGNIASDNHESLSCVDLKFGLPKLRNEDAPAESKTKYRVSSFYRDFPGGSYRDLYSTISDDQ